MLFQPDSSHSIRFDVFLFASCSWFLAANAANLCQSLLKLKIPLRKSSINHSLALRLIFWSLGFLLYFAKISSEVSIGRLGVLLSSLTALLKHGPSACSGILKVSPDRQWFSPDLRYSSDLLPLPPPPRLPIFGSFQLLKKLLSLLQWPVPCFASGTIFSSSLSADLSKLNTLGDCPSAHLNIKVG